MKYDENVIRGIAGVQNAEAKADKIIETKAKKKTERIRAYRKEASRLASMANKRLQRLENAGLKDSPAYQKWIAEGGEKFGIRGKDYNQVQSEVARLRKFLDSETSTIRGSNRILKEMAKNTGIKYNNLKELRQQSSQFFELASKIEQYLRTVEDMASAIGYQKIWEAINTYIKDESINLSDSGNNVEELTQKVVNAMDIFNEREDYYANSDGYEVSGWFQLDKDD